MREVICFMLPNFKESIKEGKRNGHSYVDILSFIEDETKLKGLVCR